MTRRLINIPVSTGLITHFLLNGINSCLPKTKLPKDIKLVNIVYESPLIVLITLESDEFEEIQEGNAIPIIDLIFESK